jgi:hypothetical protein
MDICEGQLMIFLNNYRINHYLQYFLLPCVCQEKYNPKSGMEVHRLQYHLFSGDYFSISLPLHWIYNIYTYTYIHILYIMYILFHHLFTEKNIYCSILLWGLTTQFFKTSSTLWNDVKKCTPSQVPVAHTSNPSYLGSWDWEDCSSSLAWAKSSRDCISTNSWAWWHVPVIQEKAGNIK